MPIISPTQLHERMVSPTEGNTANTNLLLFDCRYNLFQPEAGRTVYANGHLPGAYYLHLDDDLSGTIIPGQTGRHPLPQRKDFLTLMQTFGLQPTTQVVAYDDKGGGIAARLWWMLHWIGHKNVQVLDGGIQAWEAAGFSLVAGTSTDTGRSHSEEGYNNRTNLAETTVHHREAIETIRQDNDFTLVDARTAERYRGEQEPIDPIAGHIEGAINLPWPENLDRGRFKSKVALRERFASLKAKPQQNVFYCGSGVTACHNILAYYYAYGEMPALYPGSWSDWITQTKA